jgi:hypothetical protein
MDASAHLGVMPAALLDQALTEYVGLVSSGAVRQLSFAAQRGVDLARDNVFIIVGLLLVLYLAFRKSDKMRG